MAATPPIFPAPGSTCMMNSGSRNMTVYETVARRAGLTVKTIFMDPYGETRHGEFDQVLLTATQPATVPTSP